MTNFNGKSAMHVTAPQTSEWWQRCHHLPLSDTRPRRCEASVLLDSPEDTSYPLNGSDIFFAACQPWMAGGDEDTARVAFVPYLFFILCLAAPLQLWFSSEAAGLGSHLT